MTEYFNAIGEKSALKGRTNFDPEGARHDLLLEHYKAVRAKHLTEEKVQEIDDMFQEWAELLFSGFNVAVIGPQSKFALLETFVARYLESGRIPDFRKASGKSKRPPMLNITTVRLMGLDPIKTEAFNHAMLNITETRPATRQDHKEFIEKARRENMHYVFVIHSFEFFISESGEVFEAIMLLHSMGNDCIHMIISSDAFNGAKKLMPNKFKCNLIFFVAPFTESFFYEKTQLGNEFNIGEAVETMIAASGNPFDDKIDLQSLKDVYTALAAVRKVMLYIIRDFVGKSELRCDIERPKEALNSREVDVRASNRLRGAQEERRKRARPKAPETDLEFQQLLTYCESNFILRRGAVLRNHLGELKDHGIIAENESGSRIQCIVDVRTCKKFLDYIESRDGED